MLSILFESDKTEYGDFCKLHVDILLEGDIYGPETPRNHFSLLSHTQYISLGFPSNQLRFCILFIRKVVSGRTCISILHVSDYL